MFSNKSPEDNISYWHFCIFTELTENRNTEKVMFSHIHCNCFLFFKGACAS